MDEENISDPEQGFGYLCMVAGSHFSSLIGRQVQGRNIAAPFKLLSNS